MMLNLHRKPGMKRILVPALMVGFLSLGVVGCGETSKTEEKVTTQTPNGSDTVKKTVEETKTGNEKTNP